ncbi:cytochrome c oxidase assembly protein [Alkalilimnicola ehrlichii]|uniref:cytochrome c oxidase assembly protein n=1 Tax=Alkalilimnicola ehrlichii TaxID=351052 RepID=UPI00216334F3|nr:cytochrome c oxidase assembly protein [Alkalilimnicola ehrlichii]
MSENREQPKRHGRTVGKLLAVAFGMFAFGFALVPLYQVICEVTGLNGFVSNRIVNEPMPEVDKSRTVTVEFLANVGGGANWEFRPTVRTMEVHPGEIYTTSYYARNRPGRQRRLRQATALHRETRRVTSGSPIVLLYSARVRCRRGAGYAGHLFR